MPRNRRLINCGILTQWDTGLQLECMNYCYTKLEEKACLQNPLFVLPEPGHSTSCPQLNWEPLPPALCFLALAQGETTQTSLSSLACSLAAGKVFTLWFLSFLVTLTWSSWGDNPRQDSLCSSPLCAQLLTMPDTEKGLNKCLLNKRMNVQSLMSLWHPIWDLLRSNCLKKCTVWVRGWIQWSFG